MAEFVKHEMWYTGFQSLIVGAKRRDQANFFIEPRKLNKNIINEDLCK